MVYTEIKEKNGKKYYYRVRTMREGKKFKKKRIYLGKDLNKEELFLKEKNSDEKLKTKELKLLKKLKPKIIEILKKNKVKKAGIFGSYARGEQKKGSDIDLLIELSDKKISLLDFIELKLKLEDILRRKIDLVEYGAIKPRIKERILNEEVRIL